MHFIIRLIINAIALYAITYFNFMGIHSDGILYTLLAAFVFGLANAIVRPILMVLTCPLVVLTLGLFTLVINALIFWGLTWVPHFHVPGWWAAFWGALVMTIVSWVLSLIIREPERERAQERQS